MPRSIWQVLWRMVWPRRYIVPSDIAAARRAREDSEAKLRQTQQFIGEVRDEFGRRLNASWRKDP